MQVLFLVACCGVEDDHAWAGVDGETMEVSQELGAELVRCGYARSVSNAPTSSKSSATKPVKAKE